MDKYDEAIEYLKENPSEIRNAWDNTRSLGWCLFQFLTPSGRSDGSYIGCPTTIKSMIINDYDVVTKSPDDEISELIKTDPKIPSSYLDIRLENLNGFADIQRLVDIKYRNKYNEQKNVI